MENSRITVEHQTKNRQIYGNDYVSLETIFEILHKLGLNMVSKKFQGEKFDIKVVMLASDEDLIRLGVRTVGDRIRLREAFRKVTENSSLRPLDISQGKSTNRHGFEKRLFLISPSYERINEIRQKNRRDGSSGATGCSNKRAAD